MEGLKGSLSKLPCLTRVVARLQTLLRASPPLLLLASPHAPLLNPVIRKGLEGVPEISLVMRCLIDDTSKDCLERLAESLQSRYPGSLAHVHLKRLLDPVEAERLMCSAESFEGHLCLLISGADSLIAALWEQIRASGREGLARRIQIPRPTEEALRVFFKEVAEVARLKGFTADAARQLITLERAGEEGFEIVIHNAVVLARLTSQAFVTTWAITGALAHPTRVDTIDDVEPAWRKPPLAWPPQQEGMRVLETSSMG
ncbi:hypothetical protein KKB55_05100 [Myxococcota bacterium]|nr:hypothetical protein [Myxococcota bacterium]